MCAEGGFAVALSLVSLLLLHSPKASSAVPHDLPSTPAVDPPPVHRDLLSPSPALRQLPHSFLPSIDPPRTMSHLEETFSKTDVEKQGQQDVVFTSETANGQDLHRGCAVLLLSGSVRAHAS